jgi:hypothetical protein
MGPVAPTAYTGSASLASFREKKKDMRTDDVQKLTRINRLRTGNSPD